MKDRRSTVAGCLLLGMLWPVGAFLPRQAAAAQDDADDTSSPKKPSFAEALGAGTFDLDLRLRYEGVEQDSHERDARAGTLRTSLRYTSSPWRGLLAALEVQDVSVLGNELYNNAGAGSLDNGVRDRPVVADPDQTEMQQFWLGWQGPSATRLRAGRMELSLGNERFLGPVGFRQSHLAFDAVHLESELGARAGIEYAFLDRAHLINGSQRPLTGQVAASHINLGPGVLHPYALRLDFDRSTDAAMSTTTWGARYSGQFDVDAVDIQWDVEYATQSDTGANLGDLSLGYRRVEGGVAGVTWTATAGLEVLEGDGTRGFSTPFATLHKFNGWADAFLTTPPDGLEDLYLRFTFTRGRFAAQIRAHRFEGEVNGRELGEELDARFTYVAPWEQSFGIDFATYEADTHGVDTTKVWLYTGWHLSRRLGEGLD